MGVRALSLFASAIIVSLCLWIALSVRQVLPHPEPSVAVATSIYPAPPPATPPRLRAPRTPRSLVASAATPAPADPGLPPLIDVVNPVWLSLPRHPERSYPREAFAAGVEGVVDLDCLVEPDGRLRCAIASEAPPGWGFGEAALALSREHVMAPLVHHGAPARGRYRMRVPFTQPRL